MMLDTTIRPAPGESYTMYLVEDSDVDREKVIRAKVGNIEIRNESNYEDVFSDHSIIPVARHMMFEDYTVTLKLVPSENGTYFTIENFTAAPVEELGREDSIYE